MMRARAHRLTRGLIALVLGLSLGGCAQSSGIVMEDTGNVWRHEKVGMVSEPSGASTNEGIWVSMQGGG
jgi:hypothetical protein